MEIKRVGSKEIYRNKWMSLREDEIQRPSGARGIYSVVDKEDFVIIMPVEGEYVHLVEQYRYPVEGRYWEFPQGTWEEKAGADPVEVARGELAEETGYRAKILEYAGHMLLAPGLSSQGYHIFLAKDLLKGKRKLDAEEEDLVSRRFHMDEFEGMIREGRIKDASTICAYSLIKMKGML